MQLFKSLDITFWITLSVSRQQNFGLDLWTRFSVDLRWKTLIRIGLLHQWDQTYFCCADIWACKDAVKTCTSIWMLWISLLHGKWVHTLFFFVLSKAKQNFTGQQTLTDTKSNLINWENKNLLWKAVIIDASVLIQQQDFSFWMRDVFKLDVWYYKKL